MPTRAVPMYTLPSIEEVEATRARFNKEYVRFKAALPLLMADRDLRGRWVVFFDGEVKHSAPDRTRAHEWAVENLGRLAGFVVADVAPPRVYRVGGARRGTTS